MRRTLWDELLALKQNSGIPLCVGGDFNEIKAVSERMGCLTIDRGMRNFIEFSDNMGLIDLPMFGRNTPGQTIRTGQSKAV